MNAHSKALADLESASQFSNRLGMAVSREWAEGFDACLQHIRKELSADAEPTGDGIPSGWLHEDGERAISASQKSRALLDGGASASSVAGYSIPLFSMKETPK